MPMALYNVRAFSSLRCIQCVRVLQVATCALPGMLSGVLWNAGNIGSIFAVLPPLGFAVGYPVTQSCVLVSGLCGILCATLSHHIHAHAPARPQNAAGFHKQLVRWCEV